MKRVSLEVKVDVTERQEKSDSPSDFTSNDLSSFEDWNKQPKQVCL
jgi:hypothetical protein